MKAIKKDKLGNVLIQHEEIKVWMDVWYDSIDGYVTQWNKYIFFTNCKNDIKIQEFQKSDDNFEKASELAIKFIKDNKTINNN